MNEKIKLLIKSRDTLGECPVWDQFSQSLWRVDIKEKLLHRWMTENHSHKTWQFQKEISFFSPNKNSSKGLVALDDGIYIMDLENNDLHLVDNPTSNTNQTRFNDGKCDLRGNLWIGTMDQMEKHPRGGLFVMSKKKLIRKHRSLTISNGIDWSPDNKKMYLTDSGKKTIWEFDFDQENLEIQNKRVFAEDKDCFPDGLAVDIEGCLWSAKWDGSAIVKYDPTGSVITVYDLPIKRPTSVVFGGINLDRLFVTSASIGLKKNSGLEGSVFEIHTNTNGRPQALSNIF